MNELTLRQRVAASERISGEAGLARTLRRMVRHGACGLRTARAGARVLAALLLTRPVTWTLGVDGALRATVGRAADVAGSAGARRAARHHATVRVGAAGRRRTGVGGSRGLRRRGYMQTCSEWG